MLNSEEAFWPRSVLTNKAKRRIAQCPCQCQCQGQSQRKCQCTCPHFYSAFSDSMFPGQHGGSRMCEMLKTMKEPVLLCSCLHIIFTVVEVIVRIDLFVFVVRLFQIIIIICSNAGDIWNIDGGGGGGGGGPVVVVVTVAVTFRRFAFLR